MTNEKKLAEIRSIHPSKNMDIEIVEADITKSECWFKACADVDFVLHVASPFHMKEDATMI